MIIEEGQLRFTFPDNWRALQYDTTRFYRDCIIPTASELKAVDFLVLPHMEQGRLLLVEVKDFRGHAPENLDRIVSGELVLEAIQKAVHTLSGLYLAKYVGDEELSAFIADDVVPPAKIELVLFMEEDNILIRHKNDTRNKLRQQNKIKRIEEMTLSMRQKLKNTVGIRSRILNTDTIEERDGFLVARI